MTTPTRIVALVVAIGIVLIASVADARRVLEREPDPPNAALDKLSAQLAAEPPLRPLTRGDVEAAIDAAIPEMAVCVGDREMRATVRAQFDPGHRVSVSVRSARATREERSCVQLAARRWVGALQRGDVERTLTVTRRLALQAGGVPRSGTR